MGTQARAGQRIALQWRAGMLIRMHRPKNAAKPAVLVCVRDDGSETIAAANVGVEHDLVHYAVETELGLRDSFYSLVARGWNIADFNVPAAAQNLDLPAEAGRTEFIVGLLQIELRNGEPYADFNAELARMCAERGVEPVIHVDETALPRIRAKLGELLHAWVAVEPGAALELRW